VSGDAALGAASPATGFPSPAIGSAGGEGVSKGRAGARRAELPSWYPGWALSLADQYFAGGTSVFVLHGNTYDIVPLSDPAAPDRAAYGGIPEFLAEQLFGRWDLVLHYDLGRGLRVFAGRNEKRLKDMVDRKSTRLNSSHLNESRMPSSA